MDNSNSEKYRKYLILVKFNDRRKLAIWGTDMSDNEVDKLLASQDGVILLFESKKELLEKIHNYKDLFFDSDNFIKWISEIENEKEYATYNIDDLEEVLGNKESIIREEFKEECIDLLSLMDLFGDYAYQFSDDRIKSLIENQNTSIFRDYVYSNFLWDEKNLRSQESEKAVNERFDYEIFRDEMKNLIDIFKTKLTS